jgi:hypothetical protein
MAATRNRIAVNDMHHPWGQSGFFAAPPVAVDSRYLVGVSLSSG